MASYDDAPVDGSPREGEGPRVIRGGCGQLSGQSGGEWHIGLNAHRLSATAWEFYGFGVRLVLDLPRL